MSSGTVGRARSVRFPSDQWKMIAAAAEISDSGMAQFIRDAAFARALTTLLIEELGLDMENLQFSRLRLHLGTALVSHPEFRQAVVEALDLDTSHPDGSPTRLSRGDHDGANHRGTQTSRR